MTLIPLQVVVSSPSGTESIELAEQELVVVSTNDAERQLAISKYNDLLDTSCPAGTRSKSKSPRRTRREREELHAAPPSAPMGAGFGPLMAVAPPHFPRAEHKHKMSSASSPFPGGKAKPPTPRRPHTSAGPRDTPCGLGADAGFARMQDADGTCRRRRAGTRPESAEGGAPAKRAFGQRWLVAPRMGAQHSAGTSATSSGAPSPTGSIGAGEGARAVDQGQVRAWEEELARIELQSRRSTADMLGFACKRKRVRCGGMGA